MKKLLNGTIFAILMVNQILKMRTLYFIILLLSVNFCYSQGFQPSEIICLTENTEIQILETYKDNKGNEYIIYGKPKELDLIDIYIQKYDINDKPKFENGGIFLETAYVAIVYLFRENSSFFRCITDANDNIVAFISFPTIFENLSFRTQNLHCFKLDSSGNKIWSKTGNELLPTYGYILQYDIETTIEGDVHLLYYDEFENLGYLRISNNGLPRFEPKNFGYVYYKDFVTPDTTETRRNCHFFKNSSNEIIIAKANFDAIEQKYTIATVKIDIEGNQQEFVIDGSSPEFIQFNKFDDELYYIKRVGTQFPMYKFNSENSITPESIITFDTRPLQGIKKKGDFYYYLYNQQSKTFLQKINSNSQKLFPSNSIKFEILSKSLTNAIEIFPDFRGGVHILHINETYTVGVGQLNDFDRYLSYQYVNALGFPQIPNNVRLEYKCDAKVQSLGSGFYDDKDGSLNAYISSHGDLLGLLRQNVYYTNYSSVNCPIFQIKKTK